MTGLPVIVRVAARRNRAGHLRRPIVRCAEPGAVEAGCTNFIDMALAHEDTALKPVYKAGLAAIDAVSQKRVEKPFVELTAEQQDEVLAAIESGTADG